MQLVAENDPVLHQPTKPFVFSEHDAVKIVNDMAQLMFEEHGIGLAGPQVGFPYSVFVMKWMDDSAIGIFNPVITKLDENTEKFTEGCLSFPYIALNVTRPSTCTVSFTTSEEKIISAELTGIHARCFLHEYDHLQGINFQKHVSNLQLDIAKRKRNKILKKIKRHANNK